MGWEFWWFLEKAVSWDLNLDKWVEIQRWTKRVDFWTWARPVQWGLRDARAFVGSVSWDPTLDEANWLLDLGEASPVGSTRCTRVFLVSELRSDAGRSELIFGPGRGKSSGVYEMHARFLGQWVEIWRWTKRVDLWTWARPVQWGLRDAPCIVRSDGIVSIVKIMSLSPRVEKSKLKEGNKNFVPELKRVVSV